MPSTSSERTLTSSWEQLCEFLTNADIEGILSDFFTNGSLTITHEEIFEEIFQTLITASELTTEDTYFYSLLYGAFEELDYYLTRKHITVISVEELQHHLIDIIGSQDFLNRMLNSSLHSNRQKIDSWHATFNPPIDMPAHSSSENPYHREEQKDSSVRFANNDDKKMVSPSDNNPNNPVTLSQPHTSISSDVSILNSASFLNDPIETSENPAMQNTSTQEALYTLDHHANDADVSGLDVNCEIENEPSIDSVYPSHNVHHNFQRIEFSEEEDVKEEASAPSSNEQQSEHESWDSF